MKERIAVLTALALAVLAAPAAADVAPAGCFKPGSSAAACAVIPGPDSAGLDVVSTPDGRWVFASQNGLTVFERGATGVDFRRCYTGYPVAGCETLPYAGLRSMAVSPDGRFLYAVDDLGDVLAWFRIDPGSGALSAGGCLAGPRGAGACPAQPQLSSPLNPVPSPDGRHLYVGVGDETGAILTFALDPATGAPSFANCLAGRTNRTACAERAANLRQAASFAITPDGRAVYSIARGVDMLARDAATGQLRSIGCIDQDDEFGVCPVHGDIVNGNDVVVSPDGGFVYFSAGATIRGWRRDARTQQLTPGPCLQQSTPREVTRGCVAAPDLLSGSGLVMAPDGRNLYTLGFSYARTPLETAPEQGISEIARDPATGMLGLGGGCVRAAGSAQPPCPVEAQGFADAFTIDMSGDGSRLFSLGLRDYQGAGQLALAVLTRTPRPLPRPSSRAAAAVAPLRLSESGRGSRRRMEVPVGCGAGSACTGTVTLELAGRRRTVLGRRSFRVPAGAVSEVLVPLSSAARRLLKRDEIEGVARIVRRSGEGARRDSFPVEIDKG